VNTIHLTRYQMYHRIRAFFNKERKGKVLCISGTGAIATLFHPDSLIVDAQYPEVDIHELPYGEEEFDFVMTDQILEHVENPFLAVDEMYRVLKFGGYMITTTCLMMPIHKAPTDFWRFTPDGLKVLCKKFEKIYQCEGWGNGQALDLMINKGMQFETITPKSGMERIATHNDEHNLISTWIIAKKGNISNTETVNRRWSDLKTPEERYNEIQDAMNNDQPEESISLLEEFIEEWPEFGKAHNDLGTWYSLTGNKHKALTHYQEAAQLESDNITFQKNLADFFCVEFSRVNEALSIYKKILDSNPEDSETLLIAGNLSLANKQFDDAKNYYNRIIEMEPWNMDVLQNLESIARIAG